MTAEQVVFGAAFVVAVGCALAMLFTPNAVHVALFLVGTQIALALTFLLQGAFFVAAIQIIVYAGAIMVLFLFVIMLLGVQARETLIEPLPGQRLFAGALGLVLVADVLYLVLRSADALPNSAEGARALGELNRDPGNVEAIARVLFGRFLFPFELTSVLLVAAVVGVMVLTRRMNYSATETPRSHVVNEEAA